MDQEILVSPYIEAARDAVAALEAAGIKRVVALLAVFPEYGDWRLVLSSPSLDQTQLLKAHEQVTEVLRGDFVYRLPIIMVLPDKDLLIRGLRKTFRRVRVGGFIHLGGQAIGNRFISDAYIINLPGIVPWPAKAA